jgi:hypothetical protein
MKERDMDYFSIYKSVIDEEFIQTSIADLGGLSRCSLFNYSLVIWLTIYQRLDKEHTLSQVLERVNSGDFDALISHRKGSVASTNTGGLTKARQRLPIELVKRSADRLNTALVKLHAEERWQGFKVYAIDGSTWSVNGTEDIKKSFPPCVNQYGASPWGKMRTLHAHDLVTGIALRPAYGPHYGSKAVGEINLLPEVLQQLEKGSVVVADRLFGCFQVAYALQEKGFEGVLRMTNDRAGKFLTDMKKPGEIETCWEPSSHEQKKHIQLPDSAKVKGRFIWYRLSRKGFPPQDFYFFTTLSLPASQIMEIYLMRWHIETDLRSIKQTMNLDNIKSKSADVVAKELILGHVAYNLIRHVMAVTAHLARIDPRTLSFSRICNFITVVAPHIFSESKEKIFKHFAALIKQIRHYQHPKRNKKQHEPRRVIPKRNKFPKMRLPREVERELSIIKKLAA